MEFSLLNLPVSPFSTGQWTIYYQESVLLSRLKPDLRNLGLISEHSGVAFLMESYELAE